MRRRRLSSLSIRVVLVGREAHQPAPLTACRLGHLMHPPLLVVSGAHGLGQSRPSSDLKTLSPRSIDTARGTRPAIRDVASEDEEDTAQSITDAQAPLWEHRGLTSAEPGKSCLLSEFDRLRRRAVGSSPETEALRTIGR